MVAPFPIAKLASLAVKQISKPLANAIKNKAKTRPLLRKYVCMPPAQLYHWAEVNVKMRVMGLGKAKDVQKLNEEMATELGAELLGESVIFFIAAVTIYVEYQRSAMKEQMKEEAKAQHMHRLENRIQELDFLTDQQDARIRELSRMVYGMQCKKSGGH
ncbi:optic atrophy 3 protein homolog [Argonauta hians]